jgi:hypothetical protein
VRRIFAALGLALSACATAPAAPSAPPFSQSNDATLVRALLQEQSGLDAELRHPGPRPECARQCELSQGICGDSGRICAIAERNDGDEAMARACSDGADQCAQAKETGQSNGCDCGPAR